VARTSASPSWKTGAGGGGAGLRSRRQSRRAGTGRCTPAALAGALEDADDGGAGISLLGIGAIASWPVTSGPGGPANTSLE